jgi:hypothetical protein
MDMNKTSTKPAGFAKASDTQAFREVASAAQAKQNYERMSAADLMKAGFSTALKGAQDYNDKFLEFTHTNTNAAFEFVQELYGIKSASEFMTLATDHARTQTATLTEQTKELAAIAQKFALATTEPLKAGVTKAFNQAA